MSSLAYMIIISLQGTTCMKFTPKQYKLLYECGLLYANNKCLTTSEAVLTSLVESALKTWLSARTFKNTITTVPAEFPNRNDCIN